MIQPARLTVRAADTDADTEVTLDGTDIRVDVNTDGIATRVVLNPAQALVLLDELTGALTSLGVLGVAA